MDEFLPPFSEDCRRQHRAQRASVLKAFWSKVIVTLPIGEGGYNPGTERERGIGRIGIHAECNI